MGIFGGSKSKNNEYKSFDPFIGLEDSFSDRNLFGEIHAVSLDKGVANSSQAGLGANVAPPQSRTIRWLAYLAIPLCALGFMAGQLKSWKIFGDQSIDFAYFEVRALDVSGHPIAGAVVKNEGKLVGTTDSFGEWRQYIPVKLGKTVSLSMAKKTERELLYSTKNFAIPPVKGEKIEIRGTTQLVSVELNNSVARKALFDPSHSPMTGDSKIAKEEASNFRLANGKTVNAKENIAIAIGAEAAGTSTAPAVASEGASKNFSDVPFVSNHTSIWFVGKGPKASHLNSAVIPELVKRAKETGLKVDPASPWQVVLVNLLDKPAKISKGGGGVILVSNNEKISGGAATGDAGNEISFLRNYQAQPAVTANSIFYGLTQTVHKNVAVTKQGNRWAAFLPKAGATAWTLTADRALQSKGLVFKLSTEKFASDQMDGFYLTSSQPDPCAEGVTACELTTASYAQVAPVHGWVRLRLALSRPMKSNEKMFVSGYDATKVGDKLYEYWGQDQMKVNVTVIESAPATGAVKIFSRSQIVSNAKTPPTFGALAISQK
jgi:hypothetical protein